MEFKAVLFDFDYTLGDATQVIVTSFQSAFQEMGLPQPEREAVRGTVGYLLEDAYTMLTGDGRQEQRERFRQIYRRIANPLQVAHTRLFPGAAELLEALHRADVPAGVVSTKNTSTLRAVLSKLGVDRFLCSVTGGDAVVRPKPDPEGLIAALAALGVPPERALYCGDTVIDAETAQRAGTQFCAVLNGTTGAEAFRAFPCAHIAPDLIDLRGWLGL